MLTSWKQHVSCRTCFRKFRFKKSPCLILSGWAEHMWCRCGGAMVRINFQKNMRLIHACMHVTLPRQWWFLIVHSPQCRVCSFRTFHLLWPEFLAPRESHWSAHDHGFVPMTRLSRSSSWVRGEIYMWCTKLRWNILKYNTCMQKITKNFL